MAEVLVSNQILLPVINRLGIRFGFGDKNIEELTNENNIDTIFFVELCNLVVSGGNVRPKYIERFKTNWTIIYLTKSHNAYLTNYLVRIANFIQELKSSEPERAGDLSILSNFFSEYTKDFKEHLKYEDEIIFPYINTLETAYEQNSYNDIIVSQIKKNSVIDYIKHHDSLYVQLNDLKNLFIKYLPAFKDEIRIINGLAIMYELETDLRTHELIENNILFSKVITMEKYFLNLEKNKSKSNASI
jgi:regulator of cell morphogenesis and NO signaling